jgi:hypothetical protein
MKKHMALGAGIGALAALMLGALPAAAEYNAGVLAVMRGDHETAYKELVRPAELGITDAQFLLAALCDSLSGNGPCGQAEAYVWYSIALPRLPDSNVGRGSMSKMRIDYLMKNLTRAEAQFSQAAIKNWSPSRHIDFTKLPKRVAPPPSVTPSDDQGAESH